MPRINNRAALIRIVRIGFVDSNYLAQASMIPLPQPPKVILEDGRRAVFEIEGLFPGYGQTLGNALRRTLLSSLESAAITTIKIDGVPHEFTTIPGMLEDVVELTLNLKQVRFRMHGAGPYTATLKAKGETRVTAAALETPSQLEVVNPEQLIATLTAKNASLSMEMIVEKGRGYQPVEARSREKVEIGTIALDAAFSPVKLVNYEVENMRVGERTDYNRLRIHIETDGSITPREAFTETAKILVAQFNLLAGALESEPALDLAAPAPVRVPEPSGEADQYEELVSKKRIEDLDLSTRTFRALSAAGVKTVGMLARKTEKKLRDIEGLGDKAVIEIKKALGNLGLTLKQ